MNMRRNTGRPKLLLADDHAVLIDGLCRLLQPEFDVIGTVGDGWALLEAAERLKPDVIVVDVSMPLLNGIEAVLRLKKTCSRSKVIMLSMHGDVEVATEALKAGASGYVLKLSAAEALSHAIWEALEGRIYVSPRIARDVMIAVMESSHRKDGLGVQLTQREREVLQLVAEGRTIRGISAILKVATRTVVFHKSNIMDKLGLRTTADLTQYAIKTGLIAIEMPGSDAVIENGVSTPSKAPGVANFTPSLPLFGGAHASRCTGET
jgi:DNA-binding NarL/FixJ family response regulator